MPVALLTAQLSSAMNLGLKNIIESFSSVTLIVPSTKDIPPGTYRFGVASVGFGSESGSMICHTVQSVQEQTLMEPTTVQSLTCMSSLLDVFVHGSFVVTLLRAARCHDSFLWIKVAADVCNSLGSVNHEEPCIASVTNMLGCGLQQPFDVPTHLVCHTQSPDYLVILEPYKIYMDLVLYGHTPPARGFNILPDDPTTRENVTPNSTSPRHLEPSLAFGAVQEPSNTVDYVTSLVTAPPSAFIIDPVTSSYQKSNMRIVSSHNEFEDPYQCAVLKQNGQEAGSAPMCCYRHNPYKMNGPLLVAARATTSILAAEESETEASTPNASDQHSESPGEKTPESLSPRPPPSPSKNNEESNESSATQETDSSDEISDRRILSDSRKLKLQSRCVTITGLHPCVDRDYLLRIAKGDIPVRLLRSTSSKKDGIVVRNMLGCITCNGDAVDVDVNFPAVMRQELMPWFENSATNIFSYHRIVTALEKRKSLYVIEFSRVEEANDFRDQLFTVMRLLKMVRRIAWFPGFGSPHYPITASSCYLFDSDVIQANDRHLYSEECCENSEVTMTPKNHETKAPTGPYTPPTISSKLKTPKTQPCRVLPPEEATTEKAPTVALFSSECAHVAPLPSVPFVSSITPPPYTHECDVEEPTSTEDLQEPKCYVDVDWTPVLTGALLCTRIPQLGVVYSPPMRPTDASFRGMLEAITPFLSLAELERFDEARRCTVAGLEPLSSFKARVLQHRHVSESETPIRHVFRDVVLNGWSRKLKVTISRSLEVCSATLHPAISACLKLEAIMLRFALSAAPLAYCALGAMLYPVGLVNYAVQHLEQLYTALEEQMSSLFELLPTKEISAPAFDCPDEADINSLPGDTDAMRKFVINIACNCGMLVEASIGPLQRGSTRLQGAMVTLVDRGASLYRSCYKTALSSSTRLFGDDAEYTMLLQSLLVVYERENTPISLICRISGTTENTESPNVTNSWPLKINSRGCLSLTPVLHNIDKSGSASLCASTSLLSMRRRISMTRRQSPISD